MKREDIIGFIAGGILGIIVWLLNKETIHSVWYLAISFCFGLCMGWNLYFWTICKKMKKFLATIGLLICIYLILRGVFDIGLILF